MVVGFLSSPPSEHPSSDGSPPPPPPMSVLTTPTHVRWAMEPLGQSFALGMEDSDVILGAIRVYEQWLGLGPTDGRPKCMQQQEQEFIRDLLGHMSLVFEDKESHRAKPDLVPQHAKLCHKVLNLYSALGQKRSAQLTPATWDHFLRLLLGITDCVLHGSKHTLASSLCAQLVRVTLEQFIISLQVTGVKGELWNMLLKFCRRWLHRKAVVEQWHMVSLALTRHLMGRLHADRPPSTPVAIVWTDRHTTTLELDGPLLAYAWYRVLRVIGHPSLFVDPEVYLAAITGVHQLAQVLSDAAPATDHVACVPQLPDVNTILRILGPWLFDAALNRTHSQRFALCRAEAIRCLGGLLCHHGIGRTKQISWPFTIRALIAIQMALLEDDEVLVAAAVVSCARIFGTHGTHTLRGVGVLAGSFHHAIDHVLRLSVAKGSGSQPGRKESVGSNNASTSPRKRPSIGLGGDDTLSNVTSIGGVNITTLRRACIEACSSLLTIHSHYPLSVTKQVEKSLVGPDMEAAPGIYSTLPRYQSSNVVTILINYLKTEQDPTNQQMAMWQLTIAVQKEALFWSMGLASTRNSQVPMTITTICSFLTKVPSRWKPAVLFTALECLRYLTIVSEHLYKHVFSSCVFLISCVCEFMATNAQILRSQRTPPPYLDQLVASATSCLLEWVVTTPQLLSKAQIMVKVIATTVDAADFRLDFAPMTPHADDATRQSAQHLLEYLVKHHAHGAVEGKQVYDDAAVHYIWNAQTVVSIVERGSGVHLTVRDSSGCYTWRTHPQYVPTKLASVHGPRDAPAAVARVASFYDDTRDAAACPATDGSQTDPLLRSLKKNASTLTSWTTMSAGWDGNSGGKHGDASAVRHDAQVQLFGTLLDAESASLRGASVRASTKIKPLVAPPPAATTTHQARRLLSQLGFLSVASWGSLFPLTSSPQLLQDLQALDRLPTRETYEIGIAYTINHPSRAGVDVIEQVTAPMADCSPTYAAFLATMGSTVQASSYGGFLGHLAHDHGDAMVYSQHNYEVAFYVPTLAPAQQRLLDKGEVLIVWNECQQNYRPGTALWAAAYQLPHPKASVYIVIDPLDDGLFCVRISVQGSAFESCAAGVDADDDTFSGRVLGPLQDGMVVGSEWLGPLVRQTALNAVHVHRLHLRYKHSLGLSTQSPIRPHEKRTRVIAAMVQEHMDPMLPGEFYSALFVPRDEKAKSTSIAAESS
ncbi:Aste57867_18401 [Aphanomyces stellatus]|uniref:Aste57867_18401 protein n=1 Tax=Aphanomyces stellatus TaxID=120398 RepID=A0A485LBR7_9STRA|nr:hypothetical protein As57867_018339 [Aphanomyces stellatus]VFT95137.1 Aste57867_18401 [Aphanomyces stellatus]